MASDEEHQPVTFSTLRGGLNDEDQPNALKVDECVTAENVEFFESLLGQRRLGTASLSLTSSGLTAKNEIVHLSQWNPTNVVTAVEYFAVAATVGGGGSTAVARRDTTGTWHTISPTDALVFTAPDIYAITAQPFNAVLFVPYDSGTDRLHCWDGTNFRRTGLAAPVAPTAADTATGGLFTGTRYYRQRACVVSGSTVLLRSEPSSVLTFSPAGTKNGATITKGADQAGEITTHWELEASLDNTNWYRIARTVNATTTYTDQTASAKTYPTARGAGAPVSTDGTTITYVLLSNQAAQLNLTGTVSNGTYATAAATIAGRGWIGYDSSDTYLSLGSLATGWVAGQKYYASPDVATVLEQQAVGGTGQDYSSIGTLSEAVNAYTNLPSAKFVIVDGDQLVYAGHWTDASRFSMVGWTPPTTDPGVGNAERAPSVTTGGTSITTQVNLNNYDGGGITGLVSSNFGRWYAFKWQRIYSALRTNNSTQAYQIDTLSSSRGAIPGSIVRGTDGYGNSVIFFLDPFVGPCLLQNGVVRRIRGLRTTWKRVNTLATSLICCGCFYPRKQQVLWWLSVDGGNTPTFGIRLQTSELTMVNNDEMGRGWSTFTGSMAAVRCAAALTVTVGNLTTDVPFIGKTTPDFVQQCDTGTDDNGTAFTGTIVSAPQYLATTLNKWGVVEAGLLATADAQGSIILGLVLDQGAMTGYTSAATSLAPVASEPQVVKNFDDALIGEARAVQLSLTDGAAGKNWAAQRVDLNSRREEGA